MQTVKQLQTYSQTLTPELTEISRTASASLDALFPEQKHEEKQIQRAKELLGEKLTYFTPEQLRDLITEIQFLTDSWLDDFERRIFDGVTLAELLHERSSQ